MALIKPKKPVTPSPLTGTAPDDAAQLHAEDCAVRRRAGLALSGKAEAVPLLAARLRLEEDPSVREVLLTGLVRVGSREAVRLLVPFLDSLDAAMRNGVIESLQQMPAAAAAPELLPLLDDCDSDRRLFAIQLLGRLAHPDRQGWLLGVVERDDHVNVCLAAVEALSEIGSPETVSALERLASRFPDDPFVAFQLGAARRRFGGS